MRCGSCGIGKARRACPALGASICPTCCGTKRRVEIACPEDCGWLRSAAVHPPAAHQRQQADDQGRLRELLAGLSEPEYVVLTVCLQETLRSRPTMVPAPIDSDLRDAAAALRATFETEARGLVYEHRPDGLVAARLADALRGALARLEADGLSRLSVHAPTALRRIERLAGQTTPGQRRTAFLEFLERVLRPGADAARAGGQLAATALDELQRLEARGDDSAPAAGGRPNPSSTGLIVP